MKIDTTLMNEYARENTSLAKRLASRVARSAMASRVARSEMRRRDVSVGEDRVDTCLLLAYIFTDHPLAYSDLDMFRRVMDHAYTLGVRLDGNHQITDDDNVPGQHFVTFATMVDELRGVTQVDSAELVGLRALVQQIQSVVRESEKHDDQCDSVVNGLWPCDCEPVVKGSMSDLRGILTGSPQVTQR